MIAQHERSGFETKICFDNENSFNYIGAAALSARGTTLGRTAVIDMKLGDSSNLYDARYNSFVYTLAGNLKLCRICFGAGLLAMFFLLFACIRARYERQRVDALILNERAVSHSLPAK